MISTFLYTAGFLFLLLTYFYVTVIAVSVGVRTGLITFMAMLPSNGQSTSSADKSDAIMEVLEAEDRGEISPENAQIILRNIRGEKD